MLTLTDIKVRLAERYDATELVSILQIESSELAEAFMDRIEEQMDILQELLSEDSEDQEQDTEEQ